MTPARGFVVYAGVAVAVFGLYLVTLSPGVLGGDAGELQFVPPILGLTHPTGYPLQVLVHWLWSHVPIGTVAYRLNLLDAAFAAAAVGVVSACGHLLSGRLLAAALAALTFGLGELWWSQAVRGDKYTLNCLFLAVIVYLYVRWRNERSGGWLRALALVFGLSLAHHRSTLLVSPALLLSLMADGWRPGGWREPAKLAGLVVLPLALYAYVPWAGSRGLPPGAWPVDTVGAFVEYLLDRGYTSQIRLDIGLIGRLEEEGRVLFRSVGLLGVALGCLGFVCAWRRDWRAALFLTLVFVPQAVVGASYLLESHYALPRHWVFYLPAFLIWSLWIAVGLAEITKLLERAAVRADMVGRRQVLVGGIILIMFVAAQATTVWIRPAEALARAQLGAETLDGYRQDLQRSRLADRFGRLSLASAKPNAIVVCDWEQATVLWYLQRVEGIRPDVLIRYPMETLDENLSSARLEDRPLYACRTVPDLADRGIPSSVGPLLEVWPKPGAVLPTGAISIGTRFEDGPVLAGVLYHTEDRRVGRALPFTLVWRAERQIAEDLSVSVRLIGPDGTIVAQHDELHPALGTSPTSRWQPGDVVGDYRELPLGSRLTPGPYRLVVVMYRPDSVVNLRVLDRTGQMEADQAELPPFEVTANRTPLTNLLTMGRQ